MLEKNDQMLNIVPVAPEDKSEKNIEFGFEHELFEAEKIEQNNSFDNINSALIKTYGKKVFKLNPYKDLNPVSIENVNIQLNDSNGFLSGEVKAKVLDETLNDRSNFIKTKIQDLEEAKQLAEEIAEQRNELENKISDFDEVQTYISNDIETSPILEDDIVEAENEKEPELFNGLNTLKPEDIVFEFPKFEEDVIDIRYQLEKASVNYYVFDKYREKPVIKEEVELVEETIPEIDEIVQVEPMEHIIDISDMVQQTSTKFYEEKKRDKA